MTERTRYHQHPDAASTQLGDEVVALHLGTKRYYTLNVTAARIWRELEQCVTVGSLEEAVVDDFVIEIPDARPHVATVVRRLLDLQLIVPCTSGDTSSS